MKRTIIFDANNTITMQLLPDNLFLWTSDNATITLIMQLLRDNLILWTSVAQWTYLNMLVVDFMLGLCRKKITSYVRKLLVLQEFGYLLYKSKANVEDEAQTARNFPFEKGLW